MAKKHQIGISNKRTRSKANRSWRRQYKVTLSGEMRKNINPTGKDRRNKKPKKEKKTPDILPIDKSSNMTQWDLG